jgi:hypothetical protein
MMAIEGFFVPIDFSEPSMRALEEAVRIQLA